MHTNALTRRAFMGGILGAGALALPLARTAAAATDTVYVLDPNWGAGTLSCGSSCGGCVACVTHSQNKIFASAAAADVGRAHPRCKCVVQSGFTVDSATYQQLFAGGGSTDRRYAGVTQLLAASATAPAAGGGSVPAAGGGTPPSAISGTLPSTGGGMVKPLTLVGAGMLATGIALRASAGRRPARPS